MPRIDVLDVFRGFALLGLPLMNLVAFSMPFPAYVNPQAFHGENTLNHIWFSVFYVFADQKFMGIFSVLFGAGLALLHEKFEAEDNPKVQRGSGTIYIRLFVLLVFGYLHMTYLWSGDVLMLYAAWGMCLFPLVGVSQRGLSICFAVLYSIVVVSALGANIDVAALNEQSYQQFMLLFIPSAEQAQQMTNIYQGSLADIAQFENTLTLDGKEIPLDVFMPLLMESISGMVRAGAMISLGFLVYKNGFLTGGWSRKTYQLTATIGVGLSIVISAAGLIYNYGHDYRDPAQYYDIGNTFIVISSPFMVLGYIALIQLLHTSGKLVKCSKAVSKVGQMALTMYLMQSLISVFLFWGIGLSWYGQVDRTELVVIALCIGLFQLTIASLWLSFFKYGPMEWLWRCLTYRSLVGIVKTPKPK